MGITSTNSRIIHNLAENQFEQLIIDGRTRKINESMIIKQKPPSSQQALDSIRNKLGEFQGALNYTDVSEYKLG